MDRRSGRGTAQHLTDGKLPKQRGAFPEKSGALRDRLAGRGSGFQSRSRPLGAGFPQSAIRFRLLSRIVPLSNCESRHGLSNISCTRRNRPAAVHFRFSFDFCASRKCCLVMGCPLLASSGSVILWESEIVVVPYSAVLAATTYRTTSNNAASRECHLTTTRPNRLNQVSLERSHLRILRCVRGCLIMLPAGHSVRARS